MQLLFTPFAKPQNMHFKLLALLLLSVALRLCLSAPTDGKLLLKPSTTLGSQESPHEYDKDVEDLHGLLTSKNQENNKSGSSNTESTEDTSADDDDEEITADSDSSPASSDPDLPSFHDTPRDMAEYVFWTGDRKSVTGTVEEFVNQGLMNPQEASKFLEQVQSQLEDIQARYGVANSGTKKISPNAPTKADGEITVTTVDQDEKPSKKTVADKEQKDQPLVKSHVVNNDAKENGDDDAGLGNIIYQLSRILFTQSLQGGKSSAQNSLNKFAEFLEKGSQEGKLSPKLQKKVLNLLLMSLSDAMADQKDSKQQPAGKKLSPTKS